MLWVAAVYSAGILAGGYAWRPALWWIVGGVACMAAASYFASRRSALAWLMALSTFFLAGALHIQLRSALPRLDTGILPYADRHERQVTAHVTNEGRIQRGGFGELRQTLDLESEEIQTEDGQIVPVHSGIRVSIYTQLDADEKSDDLSISPSVIREFHYGDRIRFLTKTEATQKFPESGHIRL